MPGLLISFRRVSIPATKTTAERERCRARCSSLKSYATPYADPNATQDATHAGERSLTRMRPGQFSYRRQRDVAKDTDTSQRLASHSGHKFMHEQRTGTTVYTQIIKHILPEICTHHPPTNPGSENNIYNLHEFSCAESVLRLENNCSLQPTKHPTETRRGHPGVGSGDPESTP